MGDNKIRTTLYLPIKTFEFIRENGINLSRYVEECVENDYLGYAAKQELLLRKRREVLELESELSRIEENRRMVLFSLTKDEEFVLCRVVNDLGKGRSEQHCLAEFNANVNHSVTLAEFRKLVNYVKTGKKT